jgi:hypothetical protein
MLSAGVRSLSRGVHSQRPNCSVDLNAFTVSAAPGVDSARSEQSKRGTAMPKSRNDGEIILKLNRKLTFCGLGEAGSGLRGFSAPLRPPIPTHYSVRTMLLNKATNACVYNCRAVYEMISPKFAVVKGEPKSESHNGNSSWKVTVSEGKLTKVKALLGCLARLYNWRGCSRI